jgi:hypothetical protein
MAKLGPLAGQEDPEFTLVRITLVKKTYPF